jgi:hypothetical protein
LWLVEVVAVLEMEAVVVAAALVVIALQPQLP